MINDASHHLNGEHTLRSQEKQSKRTSDLLTTAFNVSNIIPQRVYEATCTFCSTAAAAAVVTQNSLASVIGHCSMAGYLNTSAYLVPDVGQSKVQVGGLWVQLDVREHVTELHCAYWSTQVAGLEGNAQCVSVVYQGCTAGDEVGHTTDTDGAVATSTARELAVGEDTVE